MGAAEFEKSKIFCQQMPFAHAEPVSVGAVMLLCTLARSLVGLDNFCRLLFFLTRTGLFW